MGACVVSVENVPFRRVIISRRAREPPPSCLVERRGGLGEKGTDRAGLNRAKTRAPFFIFVPMSGGEGREGGKSRLEKGVGKNSAEKG